MMKLSGMMAFFLFLCFGAWAFSSPLKSVPKDRPFSATGSLQPETKNPNFKIKSPDKPFSATGASQTQAKPGSQGKKTGVSFARALPEDIFNENFPDKIESFDFPNANLLDLVKAIGKLTGINFIVDPAIQSKRISIIAPSSITVAEAYKAFLSALSANGYTLVKSGAFWKITDTKKAHKDNIEVYSGDYFPNTDQLITRIIKLSYINAKNFVTSIKWLLSQDNQIMAFEDSNSIVLSDYGSVIERIMKIVREMDIPGSEEKIQAIPIRHASAEELADMLKQLLSMKTARRTSFSGSRGKPRARDLSPTVRKKSGKGNVKISNIIPDPRTNSLVISANEGGFKKIRKLVEKLDTAIDASRMGGVYVYNVLYGTAQEVYNTLMGISSSDSKKVQSSARPKNFRPSPYSRSPRPSPYPGVSGGSPLFNQNVIIMADNNTNSLIISAKNKYDYERVLAVLKKIDVPRDQVFIQAIIVEMIVNKGDSQETNLGWGLSKLVGNLVEDKDHWIYKDILGSTFFGVLNRGFDVASLQKAQFGPGFILGFPFLNFLNQFTKAEGNFQSLPGDIAEGLKDLKDGTPAQQNRYDEILAQGVRAFASSSTNQALNYSVLPLLKLLTTAVNVNILSTPQLTTLDNVSASIEVGENAPVGLINTSSTGFATQNSVDRQDITLKLEITPRINPESGTVQMDIKQKFDDFSDRSPTASELASRGVHVVKRNIETKMALNDGEVAVLGGLLTDKEVKKENKVPILGDLPVVGWLFKGTEVSQEKRNLLIFISPTIIKGEKQREKAREIVGQKMAERIHFIKKYMKGEDPHGQILKKLIPESKTGLNKLKESEDFSGKPETSFEGAFPSEDLLPEDFEDREVSPEKESEGFLNEDREGGEAPYSEDFEDSESGDFDPEEEKEELLEDSSLGAEEVSPSEDLLPEEENLQEEDFAPALPAVEEAEEPSEWDKPEEKPADKIRQKTERKGQGPEDVPLPEGLQNEKKEDLILLSPEDVDL